MTLKIAIIGAGGTGAAAARFLAKAGHQVTVYEQFALDHNRGSSYGGSRIIRRTYSDPLYTHLMAEAYPLWADLELESGETLFRRCGGLTFGHRDNPLLAATEESLRTNAVSYDALSSEAVAARFPAFSLGSDYKAIYQEESGLLRASCCVRAQMRLAIAVGATLRANTSVEEVYQSAQGGLQVVTASQTECYDRVLFAAGPWIAHLLGQLSLPLTVTRQYYAHFAPRSNAEQFSLARFPVWIDLDTNMYGFPLHDEMPGVKIAQHLPGITVDPDDVPREITELDRKTLLSYAAVRLPLLSEQIVYEQTCLYTNTPDEDFRIDAVPDLPGAYFCSGCSGHGFKFTILLGKILAMLAEDKTPVFDISRFRLPIL